MKRCEEMCCKGRAKPRNSQLPSLLSHTPHIPPSPPSTPAPSRFCMRCSSNGGHISLADRLPTILYTPPATTHYAYPKILPILLILFAFYALLASVDLCNALQQQKQQQSQLLPSSSEEEDFSIAKLFDTARKHSNEVHENDDDDSGDLDLIGGGEKGDKNEISSHHEIPHPLGSENNDYGDGGGGGGGNNNLHGDSEINGDGEKSTEHLLHTPELQPSDEEGHEGLTPPTLASHHDGHTSAAPAQKVGYAEGGGEVEEEEEREAISETKPLLSEESAQKGYSQEEALRLPTSRSSPEETHDDPNTDSDEGEAEDLFVLRNGPLPFPVESPESRFNNKEDSSSHFIPPPPSTIPSPSASHSFYSATAASPANGRGLAKASDKISSHAIWSRSRDEAEAAVEDDLRREFVRISTRHSSNRHRYFSPSRPYHSTGELFPNARSEEAWEEDVLRFDKVRTYKDYWMLPANCSPIIASIAATEQKKFYLVIFAQTFLLWATLSNFADGAGQKQHGSSNNNNHRYGALPRQFECFSCMSLAYQDSWEHLQSLYTAPKVFTDRCNDPHNAVWGNDGALPTVLCGSMCVTLMEAEVEAGLFLGYKYIRGCVDRILRHGFNMSALRTFRFSSNEPCRAIQRSVLFSRPDSGGGGGRGSPPSVYGEVQLCACFGEKCNGGAANGASSARNQKSLIASILWPTMWSWRHRWRLDTGVGFLFSPSVTMLNELFYVLLVITSALLPALMPYIVPR